MLSSWELKLVWRYQICGRFGGQCPVFGATRCGMPGLVGKNGGFFTCKRPCWCCPGGIGKEVKFWLVLVPTKNCPDSCIETHVQVLDCPSNVHCGWAPFLRCWTDFGCQEKQVGSLLGGSSSCAKHSCWEPASLSGSSLHTSSPHTCSSCAQCIPNFLSQYMMCVSWLVIDQNKFHCSLDQ